MLGLIGKSGSGKTTLLKCIFGLEDLNAGEVNIDSEQVLGPSFNLIPGHRDMKLVSQEFYVLENHTVEENVFDKLVGFTNEYKLKRTSKILNLLELTNLKTTRAKHLSSGQKQRVAIARALAVIPKVLLLDEPFSNLDNILTQKLFSFIIKEVKNQNTSVILITHLAEEALKYADSLAIIDNGKLSQYGPTWKVYYQPKNTRLAGLLGDYNVLNKTDLDKKSKFKIKSKLFLRPDKIKPTASKENFDLELLVHHCSFNGRCFEILGNSKNNSTFMVYHTKPLPLDKIARFSIELL